MLRKPTQRPSGMTLIEVVIVLGALAVFMTGVLMALLGSQRAFAQNQVVSILQIRAQNAMERIIAVSRQAITQDTEYELFKPPTGINSHGLRFRLIQSVDAITGQAVYDDVFRVFIYGPDPGDYHSQGVVVGRGPDLATIHATGCGPDGFLGTSDDDTSTPASAGGPPAVELLIPSTYAPQTGEMFTINAIPAPDGRLLVITLRLNARELDGSYVLPNDLTITERVALIQ